MSEDDLVRLERWSGPWDADDPDAGFKEEVAAYTRLDPLTTLQGLSEYSGIPVGALARYVLVKWSAAGSEGLLEIGPTMVDRLWACVAEAERTGTDADRLTAYHALKDLLAWLRAGLGGPAQ
jgi:hypothetical protein